MEPHVPATTAARNAASPRPPEREERGPTERRRLRRSVVTASVVALVSGGLAAVGGATDPYGSVLPEPTAPVTVAAEAVAHRQGYEVARAFVGVVEARRESRVGFELGGRVADVSFDEGDFVEAGEVVARLDTSILEAERETLRAARDEARAAAELAAITRERVATARAKNAVSSQQWDEADKSHQSLVAALARADAAVAAIDTRLAKAELRAPFAALVAERLVDEGQVVAAGAPVFQLLESAAPEVRIGVGGDAIDGIRAGQETVLRVRDERIPATVKAVLPVRGNGTRSVDVIFTLHAEFDGIRRGDLATLEVARPEPGRGFWLPLTALTESSRGLWACYVAEPLEALDAGARAATHRLRRRELEIIHLDGDRVYVRGTLKDGELVVTEGLHRLVPDQLVRIASGGAFSTWRADS